jgi:signal peptidase I
LGELGAGEAQDEQTTKVIEEIVVEEQPHHLVEGERVSLARTFGGRSLLREVLETALLTAIIFLVLNTTTGRFQVRGSSMEPTLYDGQYMLISKVTYWIHPPERGDVIVFHPPNDPGDDYIKRIVGLPGERVEIQNGHVSVDGVLLQEPYIANPGSYAGVWELGDRDYFVLGDNRRNSSDSHTWGMFPEENIVGKAWLCYWPPERWDLVTHYAFPESVEEGD